MLAAMAFAPCEAVAGRERGYAEWNADSATTAGAELTVKAGEYVDRAVLRPIGAVRTLAPLMDLDKEKVILPAGGVLAQMSGGRTGEYCTRNHGEKLGPPGLPPTLIGGLLCFKVDDDGNSIGLHYISGSDAALLREYGIDFARGARRVNSVHVEQVSPDQYPPDVEMGMVGFIKPDKNGKLACLRSASGAAGGKAIAFGFQACFSAPGESLSIGGGHFTLVGFDADAKTVTVRVDSPIKIRNLVPRVLEH
jgi:hypothetical protein